MLSLSASLLVPPFFFFSSLPFYPPIPPLSSFLSGSSEDTGKSSLSAERHLPLIRPDLGHKVQRVTMTTSVPGYPSGGKDQLKGTVISLGHTVFILSSGPGTNTILWEEGGREGEKEISGFYFFLKCVLCGGGPQIVLRERQFISNTKGWGWGSRVFLMNTVGFTKKEKISYLAQKWFCDRFNGRRTGVEN